MKRAVKCFSIYIKPGESCVISLLGATCNGTSKIKVVEEEAEVLVLPVHKATELIRENPQWIQFIFELYNRPPKKSLGMFRDGKRFLVNFCYHFVTRTSKHTDYQQRSHLVSGNSRVKLLIIHPIKILEQMWFFHRPSPSSLSWRSC
jgi:hypothetical protein